MALSVNARRYLRQALRSTQIGDEVADVIDAGSGTLSTAARRAMQSACVNDVNGTTICDNIDAGTALDDREINALGFALASRVVANEIQTELSS